MDGVTNQQSSPYQKPRFDPYLITPDQRGRDSVDFNAAVELHSPVPRGPAAWSRISDDLLVEAVVGPVALA